MIIQIHSLLSTYTSLPTQLQHHHQFFSNPVTYFHHITGTDDRIYACYVYLPIFSLDFISGQSLQNLMSSNSASIVPYSIRTWGEAWRILLVVSWRRWTFVLLNWSNDWLIPGNLPAMLRTSSPWHRTIFLYRSLMPLLSELAFSLLR